MKGTKFQRKMFGQSCAVRKGSGTIYSLWLIYAPLFLFIYDNLWRFQPKRKIQHYTEPNSTKKNIFLLWWRPSSYHDCIIVKKLIVFLPIYYTMETLMPLLMALTSRALGCRVQHIYFSLPLASEMSYGKKVVKFKPKVPALQGRGLGRKKNRKKKFFFNP